MHSYALDAIERRNFPFYFALVAFGLTFGIRSLSKVVGLSVDFEVYIPSGFAAYGLLYLAFDQYLWRFGILRRVGIVQTPNVNGTWNGSLRSSHSDFVKEYPIVVKLHQTWSSIRITLEADRSFSASDMACIILISPNEFELRWEYRAEAKDPGDGAQFNHRGVTNLRFHLQQGLVQPEMKGNYYTQHGRDTNGTLFVKRSES